jgi:regulator of protease activity HflC (stomatin/prohibitin superfamily)
MEALLGILPCMGIFFFFIFMFLVSNIKQVDQYESGVLFDQGRFSRMLGPGWHFVIPVFQRLNKIDLRIKAVEVEGQETMSKDNVSIHVNAVIYYKVNDAAKAVIEVQHVDWAISQLAQTTMRNVIGEATLDEVLAQRHKLSKRIEDTVDKTSETWGVVISNVELKDIVLPESLKRTMAKVAEAERERDASILKAEGEVVSAENLAKAGRLLAGAPGAMHIRTLNTLNDISSDESNTIVVALPIEILSGFAGSGAANAIASLAKSKK